ncbi:DUF397 domain-containing protein [Streptomyces sp. ISL-10]|uniref:DUF397 domain-containing protein n=1 Tax=Streptomyces sp. ISL-10 TaxID=2819172 RepID=UPI001BE9A71D|nr:DUF397 domain-containing protein [Streptomyces sp. ISL-10]MBT2365227.1 DUF397 domain-containing protein [Streptomyces sp. ISL-10]
MSPIHNASAAGYDWFKSSYSSGDNNCVESAKVPGIVPVRDSKNPEGPALSFQPEAWGAFLNLVKGSDVTPL